MWIEKHGAFWRIRDLQNGKKVLVKSGFETKTAAKQAMTKAMADQLRGEYIDPRAGRIPMSDMLERWWAVYERQLKPSARMSEGSRLRKHLLPDLGKTRLDEFDNGADQWWVSQMIADGMAPKSVRNCHGLLYIAMEFARTHKMIRSNPCRGTKIPQVAQREMRFLTQVEGAYLIQAFPPEWRPVPLTLLGTGIRWAELAGLKIKNVDLLAKTIRIEETLQYIPGEGLVTVKPKTQASRRTIRLPLQVADALASLVVDKKRSDYVFLNSSGEPLTHHWFWHHVWEPYRLEADLEELRIHDCRHTHASWLIADGRPLTGIQRRLGHTSIAITSDLYGHLLPDVDLGIVETLEAALSVGGILGEMGNDLPGATRNNPALYAGRME